jgi:hypothetical protein
MTEVDLGMYMVIGDFVKQYAGKEAREKVMEGVDDLVEASGEDKSLWVKGAIDRLDELLSDDLADKVMVSCGHVCARINGVAVKMGVEKRMKYGSVKEYLEAEQRNPIPGTKLEREGDILHQYYMPNTLKDGLRCFCSRVSSLPADQTISSTYCNCSKGYAEKFWEAVLGRSVKVELVQSTMTGDDECKFKIHL